MTERGHTPGDKPAELSTEEREKALSAWEKGTAKVEEPPVEGDADGYVAPPRRSAFPPSFFVLLACGLALLALEPTSDLGYELFGPSQAVDLGEPGHYQLDAAPDGGFVKIAGILGSRYATYSRFGSDWEARQLLGTAVLVRRPPREHVLGPGEVERYEGSGRLLKFETTPATWVERLVRPAARYTPLYLQFAAFGELPAGRPAYLLLEGDAPRAHVAAILLPFALWAGALLSLYGAWRSARLRREARLQRLKLARMR